MTRLLNGKTAVITGGNGGIGLATARRFVGEGATVFITGRRQTELDTAVKSLGESAIGVQGDVARPADLDRLYAAVVERGQKVDVLFANAAIVEAQPLGGITADALDRQLDVDLKGVVFTVQKALPLLNDGASIILNGSNVGSKAADGFGVYAAIKAAVRSFARTWASELRGRNIRVNVVSPGATATPGLADLADQLIGGPDAVGQLNAAQDAAIPLGRLANVDEVANAVAFLASNQSSYVTGTELLVDGAVNAI